MKFSDEQIEAIFDRSSGKCHLCHKRLAFKNYARLGEKGAWEVEHSKPRIDGGTNRLNNLYAAHISCNRSKGSGSTRTARARNGVKRAPLSRRARRVAKIENAVGAGVVGVLIGAVVLGPPGLWLGGLIGSALGHGQDPDCSG